MRDLESADTLAPAGGDSMRFEAPAPKLAGRYELLGLLGTGGMGAVYRVRDTELGEVVALKMLHPDWARTPEALERFRSEVRLARRVTHRHVARTFDIGEHEGERFLTMECVDGGSLAARLAERGALPPAEVIEIARAIAAALGAAHQAGVVHRDLKPENVLFARDGRVVVTDFGIAHAGGAETAVVGTPAYMAPEQLVPGAAIDHRADLFALGVLMYEMLTGERAWTGSPAALLAARAAQADPLQVTGALGPLVRRCTAIAPADRPASADEVVQALPASTPAQPPPAPARMPLPSRAGKTVAVLPLVFEGPEADRYVADGLTSDLIDTLSMTRGLLVRPRGVVARYAGTTLSPAELGRELGVDVIVEGSVRPLGSAIRIGVRLIGTEDGFQLWARRFDTALAELLGVSDAVAQAIASALTAEMPALAQPATDHAAIELYLRAKQEFWTSWQATSKPAAEMFERALALAPNDGRILSATARALARMMFFGEGDREVIGARGREVAERAVAVAPELGDSWAALATCRLNSDDPLGAADALRRGLVHAPNSVALQDQLGRVLSETGPIDEAATRLGIAIDLDPTLPSARIDLSRLQALRGDWAQVDVTIGPLAKSLAMVAHRARFALWRREPIEIGDAQLGPFATLYRALLSSGTLTDTQRAFMAEREANSVGRMRPLIFQRNAEMHAYVGDFDAAFVALRGGVDAGLLDLVWIERCPLLAPMRDDPRYPPLHATLRDRSKQILDALR